MERVREKYRPCEWGRGREKVCVCVSERERRERERHYYNSVVATVIIFTFYDSAPCMIFLNN